MSEQKDAPDVGGFFSALTLAFGLTPRQQTLVIRIAWVVVVSTHIAWACGFLTILGLSGFARADDVRELQKTVAASARVTISQEIRQQVRVRCATKDQNVADSLTRYIDNLQVEYERLAGQRFPEPPCGTSGMP